LATTTEDDIERIFDRLSSDDDKLPVEAIVAADANRTAMVPLFLRAIEQSAPSASVENALFFAFHLLGQWREKSAYRPLAALLRRAPDDIERILGDARTETSHRVMAAVFDGDPGPLCEVILDPQADEFIRERMFDALVIVTLHGELPREQAARFLKSCYADLQPQEDGLVWDGWQRAICRLGLRELLPLVKQAFDRELVTLPWMNFERFEQDLQHNIGGPEGWQTNDDEQPFGDTIEELSGWDAFSPDREDDPDDVWEHDPEFESPSIPVTNPYRGVGRNDPCPCGSGKKFKKCCLDKARLNQLPSALQDADPEFEDWDDAVEGASGAYDPFTEPDAQEWLALDEQERVDMVVASHRRAGIHFPREQVHAIIHVIVENQIADPELPVRRIAQRLMSEGLDRHEAVHAIGSVLAGHLHDLAREVKAVRNPTEAESDPHKAYFDELEALTAEEWRRSG